MKTITCEGVINKIFCTRHNYRWFNLFTLSKRPFSEGFDPNPPSRWWFGRIVECKFHAWLETEDGNKLITFDWVPPEAGDYGQKPNLKNLDEIDYIRDGQVVRFEAWKVDGQVPQLADSEYYPKIDSIRTL